MPYVGKISESHTAPMLVPTACLLVLAIGTAIARSVGARRQAAVITAHADLSQP
jgi:hypothetical protein